MHLTIRWHLVISFLLSSYLPSQLARATNGLKQSQITPTTKPQTNRFLTPSYPLRQPVITQPSTTLFLLPFQGKPPPASKNEDASARLFI